MARVEAKKWAVDNGSFRIQKRGTFTRTRPLFGYYHEGVEHSVISRVAAARGGWRFEPRLSRRRVQNANVSFSDERPFQSKINRRRAS